MIESQTVLSLAEDVTFQPFKDGKQTVILRISTGQIFTCNQTTTSFLKALDGKRSFGEAVDGVLVEYAVDREKLIADLTILTEKLLKSGLVIQKTT